MDIRCYYAILLIILSCNFYGQTASVVDTSAVKFKAALFTVSEYGLADKETILNDIQNQDISIIKSGCKQFLFVRIKFSQPFRRNKSQTILWRSCNYYLAYNSRDYVFYRLGGFDTIDIDQFIKDFEGVELSFSVDDPLYESINMGCLYDYYNMSDRKRRKYKFTCLENCVENTQYPYFEK